jgi:hypothetical protein
MMLCALSAGAFAERRVSYTFIKRLGRMRLVSADQFDGVKFQKREDELYGIPFYEQARFRQRRKTRV